MHPPDRWACLLLPIFSIPALLVAADLPTLTVPRVDDAPVINGTIGEAEWAAAAVADTPFVQVRPDFGQPSPFRTVVRVAQTTTALYVAFEAFDSEPTRLAAAVTTRDGELDDDDSVTVVLDTFGDDRTAYSFGTNALATQQDGRVADNGRTVDLRWDAAWRCAARRLADGWTVEMEIPFAILKYANGDKTTWGVNFIRTVPRRLETAVWSGPTESAWRVSRFGRLEGIEPPAHGARAWQLIPYALATAEEGGSADIEAGADLRWRPSSRLGIDLTANPDFALVEADVETINLSRFELFVPEKRPFFLEGAEMFSQRIRQFYSRRIGDLTWGAKASGKLGDTDFSAIFAAEDLELTGGAGTRSAAYGVARLQHSLPGGSSIGVLGANRRLGGENAGSVGIDTTLFFTETLGMTAQLLRVHGGDADGGLAWFVRPAYDSSTSHFHVRYTNLDDGIRDAINTVGFLSDDNRRELDSELTHIFWIPSGPVERIEAKTNYNRYWSQDGELRSWELEAEVEVALRNRWKVEVSYVDALEIFEKDFHNELTTITAGWDGRDGRAVFAFAGDGVNFDSDLTLYGVEASWPFGDRWRLSYNATRLELTPDPEQETTWIHVLETRYVFSPDLFLKVFLQTNESIDKENVQLLGVWRFKPPFGSLQVAYQRGTSRLGERSEQGNTLFTKLAWVF